MPRKKKQATTSRKLVRTHVFGPAPILDGEDEKAYNELLEGISRAVGPKDFIEQMWVSDITQKEWDIIRCRKYKAALIKAGVSDVLKAILGPVQMRLLEIDSPDEAHFERAREQIGSQTKVDGLISDWICRRPEAVECVDNNLTAIGVTMDDVHARAMALAIDDIDRIDWQLRRWENDRDSLLLEIERRRTRFAERLRHVALEAEGRTIDADFEVIDPEAGDEAA